MSKTLAKLDQRGTWRVLLQLYKGGRMMITQLLKATDLGQKALYNRVQDLIDLELVQEEREPYHNHRWLALTTQGKIVALQLAQILDSLHTITISYSGETLYRGTPWEADGT